MFSLTSVTCHRFIYVFVEMCIRSDKSLKSNEASVLFFLKFASCEEKWNRPLKTFDVHKKWTNIELSLLQKQTS